MISLGHTQDKLLMISANQCVLSRVMCGSCPQLNADFFLVTNEELTERHQEFQELKKLYDDLR